MRHLRSEVLIPGELETVFAFFGDASNLNEITPSWLDFSIQTPLPVEMKRGTILEYRLKIRGVPVSWKSEITEWEPPFFFIDTQTKGPYRMWVHRHDFRRVESGTLVKDTVDYALAGGVLEPLVHRVFVYPDLQRIFAYRSKKLLERTATCGTSIVR